ncbi:polyribonucleotide nucleotidyltransferase [bacterium]|nr:polyribonucleotide nucleotidyltransferase [bacterium]MCI0680335.1 polyribonucleotide nucleotidyltransferase [bacterium]
MQIKEYSLEIGGETLLVQLSDLADQAHGSAIVRYGNTTILATAVMGGRREDLNYFPLTVDYEERFYASGQILGSRFMRREGRPSDEAVLAGRVVDRTIRPLFDHSLRSDVQVVLTVLSLNEYDPDVLAVNAASLALATSDIPWGGPVSSVRIGKKKRSPDFIVNPTYEIRDDPDFEMDLTACGKDGKINMIELGGKEVKEEIIRNAMEKARDVIEDIQSFQKKIIAERGKEKRFVEKPETPDDLREFFKNEIAGKLDSVLFSGAGSKRVHDLEERWMSLAKEKFPDLNLYFARELFENAVNDLLHREAIEKSRRPDGRAMDEIRPLFAQAGGISPIIHGSGVFYRGGTHVLSALTLGGPGEAQLIDGMEVKTKKRYMHHYNFPPFSSGETGRIGGFNRRMIGHGALAEKALIPVIPNKEEFPYTIRIVSESMASNGSTSMASVCGSTLALMDAGVPITRPVAGIAMGLMMRDEKNYKVLVDLQGPEDHHGDMDLKVAGTEEGVTAIQMDVKVEGVTIEILSEAFEKAKQARQEILSIIQKAISTPRADISPYAPKIVTVKIKVDQIGMVIGPGGKMVNKIREESGAEIDIEDDGTVFITGKNGSAEKARDIIIELTRVYVSGDIARGVVSRIFQFGAMVKISPQTEGMVHISEIAPFRVEKITDYLHEGDTVPVAVKEIDEKGRLNLSIKNADPNFFKKER